MSFADEVLSSFPEKIAIPAPIVDLLHWIEAEGFAIPFRQYDGTEHVYGLLQPVDPGSQISIRPVDPTHAAAWLNSDDPQVARLAPFLRTGGDGSYAGLWLDDDGRTQIVHLGSGSGSVLAGIWVRDAVDLLRLLAMGYEELCWPHDYGETPEALHAEQVKNGFAEGSFTPPVQLRAFVAEKYGATIPDRAAQLITTDGGLDQHEPTDPFMIWARSLPQRPDLVA